MSTEGDVAAFLAARLDEDEAAARAAFGESGHWYRVPNDDNRTAPYDAMCEGADQRVVIYDEGSPNEAEFAHIARHDPARVLREVEADRRLLAEADKLAGDINWDDAIMLAVRIRAAVFSDHPDYQAGWRP